MHPDLLRDRDLNDDASGAPLRPFLRGADRATRGAGSHGRRSQHRDTCGMRKAARSVCSLALPHSPASSAPLRLLQSLPPSSAVGAVLGQVTDRSCKRTQDPVWLRASDLHLAFPRPGAPVLSLVYHGLGRDTVWPAENLGLFLFKILFTFREGEGKERNIDWLPETSIKNAPSCGPGPQPRSVPAWELNR